MIAWALKETLASERQGKDVWYRFWTVIGPCCTAEITERALFYEKADALNSNAMLHALSFFSPVEVNADDGGDFDWNTEKLAPRGRKNSKRPVSRQSSTNDGER